MSRKFVLRIVSDAGGRATEHEGRYVVDCDVDARRGRGVLKTSDSPLEARQFDNALEAMEYWRRQSNVTPLRPDGQPNRPLTAYSVEVRPLQMATA